MREIKFRRAFHLGLISACFFLVASLPFDLEFNNPGLAILLVSSIVFFVEFYKDNKIIISHILKTLIKRF